MDSGAREGRVNFAPTCMSVRTGGLKPALMCYGSATQRTPMVGVVIVPSVPARQ